MFDELSPENIMFDVLYSSAVRELSACKRVYNTLTTQSHYSDLTVFIHFLPVPSCFLLVH